MKNMKTSEPKCPHFKLDRKVYMDGDKKDCRVCKFNDDHSGQCLIGEEEV